ncbi:MAG: prepilin peptidase [Thermoguttaceae bacterium]|jgi:prepilin peptidase CpaA
MPNLPHGFIENWPIWLLSVILIVAAVIDGWLLKVPNWLTIPLVLAGWTAGACGGGFYGLAWSMGGTLVGLGLLLPAYAIGGMGAGDVKLMAGIGAWIGATATFYAFCVSSVIGGVIALAMVLFRRRWHHHVLQFFKIVDEILVIRNPDALSAIAAQRKSTMLLLPYGIPIALGTIAYFFWNGMLI